MIELKGITKRYPGVLALDSVDLALRPGEVRALLGENGAGKSTLTGVLFGHVAPDGGTVLVSGKAVSIRSPAHALELGIGLVHQHFALAPSLTVAENVLLGEMRRLGPFDKRRAIEEVAALAERTRLVVDPRARTGDLPVGVRQRVEILKVLRRDARVLLLDEPTAILAPREVDELFSVLEGLKKEGRAILFITHKLREVARVADRVTILRRGKVVAPDLDAKTTPPSELSSLMVGESRDANSGVGVPPAHERAGETPAPLSGASPAEPVLVFRGASVRGAEGRELLREATFEVRAGEIVGVAGVAGNGQEELYRLATGLLEPSSGSVERRSPVVAAIPGDRHALALAPALSCAENLALRDVARGPFLVDRVAQAARARELMERFDVRPPEPRLLAGLLSGGNQQKLVLARELDGNPKLVVALDPARGLDVRASELVARELLRAAARGAGVLLISTDLDDVLELATRAFALHEGRLHAGPLEREALGLLMLRGAA